MNRESGETPVVPPGGIGAGTVARHRADGTFECVQDEVAVEEPLEIRVGEETVAITMRTPGHDEELAAGFLVAEGIIHERNDLRDAAPSARPQDRGNAINLTLAGTPALGQLRRFGAISSSCGLCGKVSIDSIRQNFPPLPPIAPPGFPVKTLLSLPALMRAAQGNFNRTGGLHAAAIFQSRGRACRAA